MSVNKCLCTCNVNVTFVFVQPDGYVLFADSFDYGVEVEELFDVYWRSCIGYVLLLQLTLFIKALFDLSPVFCVITNVSA